jgi:outer membrane protein OmpA-like peptidoglycan-associated protein
MPEHTARQSADAEDADGSKADDMTQDVGEKPVAAAPSYEQKAGGGDDDFAPSLKPSYQSPNPDAAAATGPAAAHIPNAQSDTPTTSEAAPNAADPDAPPEQAPFGGAEPQSGAAASELPQAPTHSVAHPPAAVAPVVLRNHVLSLQTPITFVGRTGKLSGPGRKAVQVLASYLLAHKELKHIDIEVSTDNHGHARANKALAQKRANAIKQALIEHHVPAKSIRAHGLGDAHPIASNKTAAGRAKNMRVDLSAR